MKIEEEVVPGAERAGRAPASAGAARNGRPGEAGSGAVLIHSFDYPPNDGGIARVSGEVAAHYGGAGQRVRVITQDAPLRGGNVTPPDVPETQVTARRPLREWQALRALRGARGEGMVVTGIWYPEGLLALLAGVRPHVVLAHGHELMPTRARWRRGLWRMLQRRVLHGADLVVANSEYTRRLVLRSAPDARVVAIPLGVDAERFTPGDRRAARAAWGVEGKRVLCSVSRVYTYKGHDVVLRALARLAPAERERFVYLVAGQGPDVPALKELAERLGVAGCVRWLGYVADEDLPGLYRAADLFVLCTREAPEHGVEGFGCVFLEAQACGTPVVGTRSGGIPDAVRDGEGGWLIEEDDEAALAEILRRLDADPEPFRRHGQQARARVERECTWAHYLARFRDELRRAGITRAERT
jgi:phosphatidylinositol alpha-1,6-mannosyltransferase